MSSNLQIVSIFLAANALIAGAAPAGAQTGEVIRWNRVATETMAATQTDPLTESRVLAILHLAVHDTLNTVESRYRTYGTSRRGTPAGTSAEAAIASAAHTTLTALLPAGRTTFDAQLGVTLQAVANATAREAGATTGREVAAGILAMRATDGAGRTVSYEAGTRPGAYRPTPPDFTPAFFPHWGAITPFALKDAAQFRPAPPPAIDSPEARSDVAVVQRIGGSTSTTRTAEQTEIAKFWYENSPQGWNRIARELAETRELDAWSAARLLALVNVAMADGFIGGFEAKYHYNYWRPATAIRETTDATWLSSLPTPPVPDYPSTHTVLGAAAAAVLARFFETDYVSFRMTSGAPYAGITRTFWSFSEAAQENGASRVLAGIHFPTAVRAGYEQGDRIGAHTFETLLTPVTTTRMTTSVSR
jgi:hypothetical protein